MEEELLIAAAGTEDLFVFRALIQLVVKNGCEKFAPNLSVSQSGLFQASLPIYTVLKKRIYIQERNIKPNCT